MMEEKRLSKALAAAGIASRRKCEELIFSGKVKVNGFVVKVPQTLVSFDRDEIFVNNNLIQCEEPQICYLLNKPRGYICSHKRLGRKKLIYDLFGRTTQRLFSIGRLDRDTTGLLLITNDGHFANKVIHPSSKIIKEYLVKTEESLTSLQLQTISKGTSIEGKWVKPIKVKKVRHGTAKICVKEGLKREVRLFIENSGLHLISLKRIRIGGLLLGSLPEGKWRSLSNNEKEAIFS